ncbi:hypothetical protein DY000_02008056 [Brassica cretica]|uniref:Uncharacterized protein n=1 Tax=Brassica cretica TaxID=69181 RepID=A0ABQ7C1I6_BRACR|nr:hypothetical protein DY000_02008056 [Brassica cretica]
MRAWTRFPPSRLPSRRKHPSPTKHLKPGAGNLGAQYIEQGEQDSPDPRYRAITFIKNNKTGTDIVTFTVRARVRPCTLELLGELEFELKETCDLCSKETVHWSSWESWIVTNDQLAVMLFHRVELVVQNVAILDILLNNRSMEADSTGGIARISKEKENFQVVKTIYHKTNRRRMDSLAT